jgi:16S rRNA (uracil1498-N3)-methyltransferase
VLPRFFVPEAKTTGSVVQLPEDEAAHLLHVLRLKTGDVIQVFDGRGREWRARVDEVGRSHARVQLEATVAPGAEPGVKLALAIAILKGDKMDNVVRDAVMLGASGIVPLVTQRVEIPPRAVERGHRIERWRRIAIASAKQCGRAVVPAVSTPVGLPDLLTSKSTALRIMLVEPGASIPAVGRMQDLSRANETLLFVGPEGGWTASEIEAAHAAGARLATLGSLTLRADAAPLVAITALRTAWGDL